MPATRPRLIHCSYHKCLTVYFGRVMEMMYNRILPWSGAYRHFNNLIDEFYAALPRYRVLSVNNHMLRLGELGDYRITRFVRDPRDLIVSGYFYHRRGAESWCNVVDPTDEDWKVVRGHVPAGIAPGQSYAAWLSAIPEEEGLLAEIEFRRHHYESMREWPDDDPRILLFRYEDILGREEETFLRIFRHYELPLSEKLLGRALAWKYSARQQSRQIEHIRNPEPNQWKKRFTPRVTEVFRERYGDLLPKLGYE